MFTFRRFLVLKKIILILKKKGVYFFADFWFEKKPRKKEVAEQIRVSNVLENRPNFPQNRPDWPAAIKVYKP